MRSKSELMFENALLRQQLIMPQRQTKRPKLTWRDRTVMVLLVSKLNTSRGCTFQRGASDLLPRTVIDGGFCPIPTGRFSC